MSKQKVKITPLTQEVYNYICEMVSILGELAVSELLAEFIEELKDEREVLGFNPTIINADN